MDSNQNQSKLNKFLKSQWFLFIKDVLIIILLVFLVKAFIAETFVVKWVSMRNTYYNDEFIILDRISYLFKNPERGDVVVFDPHVNEKFYLKRVIWIPWDELKIQDWKIFIKQKWKTEFIEIIEPYLNEENRWRTFTWPNWVSEYKLWEDEYFLIWDNRNYSTDSRECFVNCDNRSPFISKKDIRGKVFLDLWHFSLKEMKFVTEYWDESKPKFFWVDSSHDYPELK